MATVPATRADLPVDEALCKRCGKCCYKKILSGRTVHITPFPCQYLDVRTNLCTIYQRRHQVNHLCLTVPQGLWVNAFPADCAYVAVLAPPGYRPARDDWDWADEWDDFDGLADDLDVPPDVREMVRARGPHAPPLYAEAAGNRL